jgi:hypothetical protein
MQGNISRINARKSRSQQFMKAGLIAGITLIIIGMVVLGYDHYSYTTTENILKLGPVTATAEQPHTISFPPILGWLLIAGGAGALIFGALSKKD